MKRSYQDVQKSSASSNVQSDGRTQIAPVLIELEDDNSRKNEKKNDTLLNLLIRAIVEEQSHSREKVIADAKSSYSNNILNDGSIAASTIASSTASNSTNEMDSAGPKQIFDRIPSDDRSLSLISSDDHISSEQYFSLLPNGRPLMAPPRLPTRFVPGQIRVLGTNFMSLETTLPCEVRYTKDTGKRYKQSLFPLP